MAKMLTLHALLKDLDVNNIEYSIKDYDSLL